MTSFRGIIAVLFPYKNAVLFLTIFLRSIGSCVDSSDAKYLIPPPMRAELLVILEVVPEKRDIFDNSE